MVSLVSSGPAGRGPEVISTASMEALPHTPQDEEV